jgi:cation diffusion facilitator family transporter
MDSQKQRLGYIEGWSSAVLNTLLFALKMWVGVVAGSVAMIADAWHTLSDTLTSGVVLVGFWYRGKAGDREHPFGHGRAEVIAAVVISALLGTVGFDFLVDSVKSLLQAHAASYGWFSIAVFGVSVVLKEAMAQFSMWAGRRTESRSLVADGWHHRSDAVASGLIVVGALVGKRVWWIDGALGIGVSVLILHAAFEILKDAASALMGQAPDSGVETKIRAVIEDVAPGISNVHHIHVHRYGDHVEVTLHLHMPEDLPLRDAHTCAGVIESALRSRLGYEPTIHFEPRHQTATVA